MTSQGKGYVDAIRRSQLSIYDNVDIDNKELWIPTPCLEELLCSAMTGVSLSGLPLRTRSKVVKECVCEALGYPVPRSFTKTQPRFKGQNFDTYTQKSDNLQIWNEDVSPSRRYVIIRVSEYDIITKVRVVTGDVLAKLDTTGTLTRKYQAQLLLGTETAELVTEKDTDRLLPFVRSGVAPAASASPIDVPQPGQMLPIKDIFDRLKTMVGAKFKDIGCDQERNRGAALHRLVCKHLGFADYRDNGQFPDVRHQLLEVKLQTSPTIDLGLVCPDSTEVLGLPKIGGVTARHCDVRYALFYAYIDGGAVTITNVLITTGEEFFSRFRQFQGKVSNAKLQIPLPSGFFG